MQPLTLTDLCRRLHERRRSLALVAVAGLVLGCATGLALPRSYSAHAVVQVESRRPVDMTAEQAVATSRRVTAEAVATLGGPAATVESLEDRLTVRVPSGSQVMRVEISAASPRRAARQADAVAQAYLAARAVDDRGVTGEVIDPARVPRAPRQPGPWAVGGAGGLLALLLAVPWAARPTSTAAVRAVEISRSPAARAS